jgi:hypothetical protein
MNKNSSVLTLVSAVDEQEFQCTDTGLRRGPDLGDVGGFIALTAVAFISKGGDLGVACSLGRETHLILLSPTINTSYF